MSVKELYVQFDELITTDVASLIVKCPVQRWKSINCAHCIQIVIRARSIDSKGAGNSARIIAVKFLLDAA